MCARAGWTRRRDVQVGLAVVGGALAVGLATVAVVDPPLMEDAVAAGQRVARTARERLRDLGPLLQSAVAKVERMSKDAMRVLLPPHVDTSPFDPPRSTLVAWKAVRNDYHNHVAAHLDHVQDIQWPFRLKVDALFKKPKRPTRAFEHPAVPESFFVSQGVFPQALYPTSTQVEGFFHRMHTFADKLHTQRVLHAAATETPRWAVAHEEDLELESAWDEVGFSLTKSGRLYHPSLCVNALMALAIFTDEGCSYATQFLAQGGLDLIRSVLVYVWSDPLSTEDLRNTVRAQACRIVANLAVHPSTHMQLSQAGLMPFIRMCATSTDESVRSHATRAIVNLRAQRPTDLRFEDGVFPMDIPTALSHDKNEYDVDVVFVHGLLGGAFMTWRFLNSTEEDPTIWPRESLPEALGSRLVGDVYERTRPGGLRPRMIAVDYDTALTDWATTVVRRPEMTLEARGAEMMRKLQMAGVGRDRPVIIVTHSMGGLIVKEMLAAAAQGNAEQQWLLSNTAGIVFYSTPHRGAQIATLFAYVKYLVLPSLDVQQLQDVAHLLELNEQFKQVLLANPYLSTLSVGETETLGILGEHVRTLVVAPDSSNPGYGEFILAHGTDHIAVCKPIDENDPVFLETMRFIRRALRNHQQPRNEGDD